MSGRGGDGDCAMDRVFENLALAAMSSPVVRSDAGQSLEPANRMDSCSREGGGTAAIW